MSSKDLENIIPGTYPAAERILTLLKTRGPQKAADLGTTLGITGEAARQQLMKLAADELVEASSEVRGVGRPTQVWRVTAAGNARFPDAHAELTVQLIDTIRSELGEDALERLISAREEKTRTRYAAELAGLTELEERVACLADIRSREGYMAEWQAEADGFLLTENHCPICAAAAICQGLCQTELELFGAVLGQGVQVRRIDHIIAGARRCAYRIVPAPQAKLVKQPNVKPRRR
jgi:predicted ArsR family transcriptional regulator